MSAGEYCNRDVIIIERSESIRIAVDLMRQHHVGDVVVVEKENGSAKPVGILTDRDIIIEILAEDFDRVRDAHQPRPFRSPLPACRQGRPWHRARRAPGTRGWRLAKSP
jgi:CBS domain-containing protein